MTDQDFEERLSALLTGGSDRPLAADTIIAGARRRRTRRRTAVAASSLALLGMAAGVVALDGRVPGRTTGVGPGTATGTPSLVTPTRALPTTDVPTDPPTEPHREGTADKVLALLAPETTIGEDTVSGHRWQVLAASVPDEAAFELAHPQVFRGMLRAEHKPAVWGFLIVDGEIRTAFESPGPNGPPYAFIPTFSPEPSAGNAVVDIAYGYIDPRADHYKVDYKSGASKTVHVVLVGHNRLIALADTPADPAAKVTVYDAAGNVLDSREGVTLMP